MRDVVVVDDERLILLGIKSYVMIAEDRYRVTGAFTSAKEALLFCRDHPPNILLTDIKMPVVDGLQLIRQIKSELPETKIVVLSCHDDYEYVHEAFRLGAADYILKDQVEEDELVTILDSVAFEGDDAPPRAKERTPAYTWPRLLERVHTGRLWHVVTFGFKNAYDPELSPIPWEFDSHILIQSIRDSLGSVDDAFAAEYRGQYVGCIIEARGNTRPDEELSWAHRVVRESCAEIAKYWNRTVVATLSREPVATELLDAAMERIAALQAFAFYRDRGGLIEVVDESAGIPDDSPELALRFSLAGNEPEGSWLAEADDFFARLSPNRPPHPREVKGALTKALMILSDELRECLGLQLEEVDISEGDVLKSVNDIDDIQVLKRYVRILLQRIARAVGSGRTASSLIGRAKAHVRENHSGRTSLTSTASHLNVSPAYLSHRFKVEAGETFSQYVNRARADHAKKLLSTTNWPVKRIAFEVGYDAPSYFSRVFNSVTGFYPSEYRRISTANPAPRSND
ncbi:MAG TPA: response regulator [Spirochaetia bacterium]|nr:response regulator [Spirochaetia bacterium]